MDKKLERQCGRACSPAREFCAIMSVRGSSMTDENSTEVYRNGEVGGCASQIVSETLLARSGDLEEMTASPLNAEAPDVNGLKTETPQSKSLPQQSSPDTFPYEWFKVYMETMKKDMLREISNEVDQPEQLQKQQHDYAFCNLQSMEEKGYKMQNEQLEDESSNGTGLNKETTYSTHEIKGKLQQQLDYMLEKFQGVALVNDLDKAGTKCNDYIPNRETTVKELYPAANLSLLQSESAEPMYNDCGILEISKQGKHQLRMNCSITGHQILYKIHGTDPMVCSGSDIDSISICSDASNNSDAQSENNFEVIHLPPHCKLENSGCSNFNQTFYKDKVENDCPKNELNTAKYNDVTCKDENDGSSRSSPSFELLSESPSPSLSVYIDDDDSSHNENTVDSDTKQKEYVVTERKTVTSTPFLNANISLLQSEKAKRLYNTSDSLDLPKFGEELRMNCSITGHQILKKTNVKNVMNCSVSDNNSINLCLSAVDSADPHCEHNSEVVQLQPCNEPGTCDNSVEASQVGGDRSSTSFPVGSGLESVPDTGSPMSFIYINEDHFSCKDGHSRETGNDVTRVNSNNANAEKYRTYQTNVDKLQHTNCDVDDCANVVWEKRLGGTNFFVAETLPSHAKVGTCLQPKLECSQPQRTHQTNEMHIDVENSQTSRDSNCEHSFEVVQMQRCEEPSACSNSVEASQVKKVKNDSSTKTSNNTRFDVVVHEVGGGKSSTSFPARSGLESVPHTSFIYINEDHFSCNDGDIQSVKTVNGATCVNNANAQKDCTYQANVNKLQHANCDADDCANIGLGRTDSFVAKTLADHVKEDTCLLSKSGHSKEQRSHQTNEMNIDVESSHTSADSHCEDNFEVVHMQSCSEPSAFNNSAEVSQVSGNRGSTSFPTGSGLESVSDRVSHTSFIYINEDHFSCHDDDLRSVESMSETTCINNNNANVRKSGTYQANVNDRLQHVKRDVDDCTNDNWQKCSSGTDSCVAKALTNHLKDSTRLLSKSERSQKQRSNETSEMNIDVQSSHTRYPSRQPQFNSQAESTGEMADPVHILLENRSSGNDNFIVKPLPSHAKEGTCSLLKSERSQQQLSDQINEMNNDVQNFQMWFLTKVENTHYKLPKLLLNHYNYSQHPNSQAESTTDAVHIFLEKRSGGTDTFDAKKLPSYAKEGTCPLPKLEYFAQQQLNQTNEMNTDVKSSHTSADPHCERNSVGVQTQLCNNASVCNNSVETSQIDGDRSSTTFPAISRLESVQHTVDPASSILLTEDYFSCKDGDIHSSETVNKTTCVNINNINTQKDCTYQANDNKLRHTNCDADDAANVGWEPRSRGTDSSVAKSLLSHAKQGKRPLPKSEHFQSSYTSPQEKMRNLPGNWLKLRANTWVRRRGNGERIADTGSPATRL